MGRRAFAIVLLIASSAGLEGCAVLGRQQRENPIDAARIAELRKGMTRAEVVELLGPPHEYIYSNREHDPLREHAYIYEHTVTKYTGITFGVISFGNSDEKKDRTVVFFDDDGRVDAIGSTFQSAEASYGFPFGS
ncbi:MAG TPA: outer membrane protein assembly factor BamE [Planctomycetota bacterium]|nr:outer membrane protein assembly factor BamE [Planctomycetota bacterium]